MKISVVRRDVAAKEDQARGIHTQIRRKGRDQEARMSDNETIRVSKLRVDLENGHPFNWAPLGEVSCITTASGKEYLPGDPTSGSTVRQETCYCPDKSLVPVSGISRDFFAKCWHGSPNIPGATGLHKRTVTKRTLSIAVRVMSSNKR